MIYNKLSVLAPKSDHACKGILFNRYRVLVVVNEG
jgi:hypothetical protein